MTDHDPSIEAARRADTDDDGDCVYWSTTRDAMGNRCPAREALKPIRELHKPIEYFEYDDVNGVYKTDADGEQILMGRVCAECSTAEFIELLGDCEIQGSTFYEGERDWPCETAKLIYRSDEL